MDSPSKQELIEKFYLKNSKKLLMIALKYVQDENAATDIVHDSLVKLFTTYNKREIKNLEGYAIRVIKNAAIDYLRRKIPHQKKSKELKVDNIDSIVINISTGTAPKEVISELLAKISILYRKAGGSGLSYTIKDKINVSAEKSLLARFILKVAPYFGGLGKKWLENKALREELENEKLKAEIINLHSQTYSNLATALKTKQELEAKKEMKQITRDAENIEAQLLLDEKITPVDLESMNEDFETLEEEIKLLKLKYGLEIKIEFSNSNDNKNKDLQEKVKLSEKEQKFYGGGKGEPINPSNQRAGRVNRIQSDPSELLE